MKEKEFKMWGDVFDNRNESTVVGTNQLDDNSKILVGSPSTQSEKIITWSYANDEVTSQRKDVEFVDESGGEGSNYSTIDSREIDMETKSTNTVSFMQAVSANIFDSKLDWRTRSSRNVENEKAVSTGRIYGWDPWTKRPSFRRQSNGKGKRWCWDVKNPGWWTAFMFLLGSVMFAIGSFAALFSFVANFYLNEVFGVLIPYLTGGIAFFVGTVIMFWGSVKSHYDLLAVKEKAAMDLEQYEIEPQRVFAGKWKVNVAKGEEEAASQPLICEEKDKHHLLSKAAAEELLKLQLLGNFWARNRFLLDMSGSIVLFFGVNAYNVMVIAEFYHLTPHAYKEYVVIPTDLGGLGFVVGSYLLWVSSVESWLGSTETRTMTWWIGAINVMGSLGFLIGGALHAHIAPTVDGFFVPDYFELFFGYFFGSILFAISSYLMILEISEEEDFSEPQYSALISV